jgi:hypothetical protein
MEGGPISQVDDEHNEHKHTIQIGFSHRSNQTYLTESQEKDNNK